MKRNLSSDLSINLHNKLSDIYNVPSNLISISNGLYKCRADDRKSVLEQEMPLIVIPNYLSYGCGIGVRNHFSGANMQQSDISCATS